MASEMNKTKRLNFSFLKNNNQSAKRSDIKRTNLILLTGILLIIACTNIIGYYFYFRIDLTEEKRYTLAPSTKKLLSQSEDIVYFKVYLDGDFPADFKQLRKETREMLNQFRAYSKNIEFEFINPNAISSPEGKRAFYQQLREKNISPSQVSERTKDGVNQLLVFPFAEVRYRERETVISLLSSQMYIPEAQLINNSIQNLEYVLADGIRKVTSFSRKKVGFIKGHEELPGEFLIDIQGSLREYYNVENIEIDEKISSLTERKTDYRDSTRINFENKYDALVIAKPSAPFSDKDLFILDQYVMHGGKILWLIDPLSASMDSLESNNETIALRLDLRLENLLFRYGVRVNPDLILDIRNVPIPMVTGWTGEKPQVSFMPWFYFPEILPRSGHPIVKDLNALKFEFASSIDTIENPVKKTILLTSSEYSRVVNAPAIVSLDYAKEEPDERLFNKKFLPVAVLLEGQFASAFRNRLDPALTENPEIGYLDENSTTKMIVVSDGDIIRNRFNYKEGFAYPVGYDQYTRQMYGNKEFVLNCINYLCDDEGFLSVRSRELKLRKLNALAVKQKETTYQIINTIIPVLIIICFTAILSFFRRKSFIK